MSYKCGHCGIKVNREAGDPCPGCGKAQAFESAESLEQVNPYRMTTSPSLSLNNPKSEPLERSWIQKVFDQCDEWFKELGDSEDLVNSDIDEVTPKVIAYALQKAEEAENPEDRISLYSYSAHFLTLIKEYEQAIAYGRIGLESTREFYRNQSYETLFRSYTAIRDFERLIELEASALRDNYPDCGYYQIERATRECDFDRAITHIDEYYDNNQAQNLYAKCRIYTKMGDLQKAETGYRKLIAIAGKDSIAGAAINSFCFALLIPLKRNEEAKELLIEATTFSTPRETANAWSNLGIIATAEEKYSEAREHFAKAIGSDDVDIQNESRFFLCLMDFQDYSEQSMPPSDPRWRKLLEDIQIGMKVGDSDNIVRSAQLLVNVASHLKMLSSYVDQVEECMKKLESDPLVKIVGSDENLNRDKLTVLLASMYRDLEEFGKFEGLLQKEAPSGNLEILRLLIDHIKTGSCTPDFKNISKDLEIPPVLMAEWVHFESDPLFLIYFSRTEDREIALALIQNEATPVPALVLLSTIPDIDVQFRICSHPNVTLEILKSLSTSAFDAVRRGVASSRVVDDQTLQELALDPSPSVRDAVMKNPTASDETKTLAALG